MVHTISLYEVCSKRYLDLEVQPGRRKNEFQAICHLMDRYAYGGHPIFIADRGFSSYNVFAHAIENQIDFMIRAKDLNVQRLLGVNSLLDKLDTTVELILTRTQSKRSINILNEYSGAAEPLVRCGEPRNNHKFFKNRNL
ncbi:MAG: transposase [Gallintestinimicrobium sp.]